MKKYSMLWVLVVVIFCGCRNNDNKAPDQQTPIAGVARTATSNEIEDLFLPDQFGISRFAADSLLSVFINKYQYADGNGDQFEFMRNELKLHIDIDSLLAFKTYLDAVSTNQCQGIRISFGIDGRRLPVFYFTPVLMTLDSQSNDSIYFSILNSEKYYTYGNRWTAVKSEADMAKMQQNKTNYKLNMRKLSANVFENLEIMDHDNDSSDSDPFAVTFPWIEIKTLVTHNIRTVVRNSYYTCDSPSRKELIDLNNKSYEEIKAGYNLTKIPEANRITFHWAAEQKRDSRLKHIVLLVPDYNGKVEMETTNNVLQFQAANFNTPCPHNCGTAVYKKK